MLQATESLIQQITDHRSMIVNGDTSEYENALEVRLGQLKAELASVKRQKLKANPISPIDKAMTALIKKMQSAATKHEGEQWIEQWKTGVNQSIAQVRAVVGQVEPTPAEEAKVEPTPAEEAKVEIDEEAKVEIDEEAKVEIDEEAKVEPTPAEEAPKSPMNMFIRFNDSLDSDDEPVVESVVEPVVEPDDDEEAFGEIDEGILGDSDEEAVGNSDEEAMGDSDEALETDRLAQIAIAKNIALHAEMKDQPVGTSHPVGKCKASPIATLIAEVKKKQAEQTKYEDTGDLVFNLNKIRARLPWSAAEFTQPMYNDFSQVLSAMFNDFKENPYMLTQHFPNLLATVRNIQTREKW